MFLGEFNELLSNVNNEIVRIMLRQNSSRRANVTKIFLWAKTRGMQKNTAPVPENYRTDPAEIWHTYT